MPADPKKLRKLLIVHGVQSGDDGGLIQDQILKELIEERLNSLPQRVGDRPCGEGQVGN
jgi:hypothetical protein